MTSNENSKKIQTDLAIIGSGPAGLTAAIYAGRAGLNPIVVASNLNIGGALINATTIENFPGFPNGVEGFELMDNMQNQAIKMGANLLFNEVLSVEFGLEKKVLKLDNNSLVEAKAVIVATGSAFRKLQIKGELEYSGRGVSYCATCDGAFFKQKQVAVVGGGDTALDEALYLTGVASKVYIIHRRDEFRGSKILQDRLKQKENVEFCLSKVPIEVGGRDLLEFIKLSCTKTGKEIKLPVSAVFVAIGADPKTQIFQDKLALTQQKNIFVQAPTTKTSVSGVFAAGDVVETAYKQAVIAAGAGAKAAMDAIEYLQ